MEQLAILEKICNNILDSMECGTATYIFAAAIYDDWASDSSTQLESNLAKRLVSLWEGELEIQMVEAYKKTKYDEKRLEQDEYYKKWIESAYKTYSDNQGIQYALQHLWEVKYGLRLYWPK